MKQNPEGPVPVHQVRLLPPLKDRQLLAERQVLDRKLGRTALPQEGADDRGEPSHEPRHPFTILCLSQAPVLPWGNAGVTVG